MSRRSSLIPVALAFALAGAPLLADTYPTQQRGFAPDKVFQAGDLDNINVFNGNLVVTIPIGGSYPVGGGLSYNLTLVYNSTVWDYESIVWNNETLTQAWPDRRSNAGLGWRLSLGELLAPADPSNECGPWCYVGPDGGEHIFYPTLHQEDADDPGDSGPNNQSVTYTRDGSYLRQKVVTGGREVEFPDGTIHKFNASGKLIQIRDRFNNHLDIDQSGNPWVLTDQHQRTHQITFTSDLSNTYPALVSQIDLQAFGDARATYTLQYGYASLPRACPDNDPSTSLNVTVPLLTGITMPEGLSYAMPTSDYYPDGNVHCRLPGVLKGLRLPTLGRIEWGFGQYAFPSEDAVKGWRSGNVGVFTRMLRDADGTALGTWTYTPALNPPGFPQEPLEAIRTVKTPLGDKTEHYFSVSLENSLTGWSRLDFGLPFSRFESAGGTPERFRSTKVYDCDTAGNNCTLLRSTWVAYEHDTVTATGPTLQDDNNRNRRMAASRTVFHDDGGIYADEDLSDFDGLGHYRQRQTGGSFPGSNTRTSYTNFISSPVLTGSPWVLNTFSFDWESEGGNTIFRSYCWDTTTGAMLRKRVHQANGSGQGTSDVVEVYGYSSGNLTSESFYGGDAQTVNLSGANFCTMALPASPAYQINHTYSSGARTTSQYAGATFKALDLTIDASTGLASASADTAGITTSYSYDSLSRPLTVDPTDDAMTTYTYRVPVNASTLAQVTIARVTSPGTTALEESRIDFDGLGRPVKEEKRMPDDTWEGRTTAYNALGWKTYISEAGTSFGTIFENFDPFGRPGKITPADGAAHAVTFSYAGVRQVSRTTKVATSTTAETDATTTEVYDRHGRLYEVTEPNSVKTRYEYDTGNRLSKVCQGATATACGQTRWFTYDNRGFLTSEQHPEKGTSGNGTVTYSIFDARGHAANKVDGPNALTFTYDNAERLTQISETNGSKRTLKAFTYANANNGTDKRLGKLQAAKRYNYVLGNIIQVEDSYVYSGAEGRVFQKDTLMTFNGTAKEKFRQTYTWNLLGDLSSQTYPDCVSICSPSSPRTVTYGYTNGWLTSVPGYAGSISYHNNGLVDQVVHTNGMTYTQSKDSFGMARPASLTAVSGATTLWNTGTHSYDGTGNIKKIGTNSDTYTYDSLSRLIDGRLPNGKYQTVSYDNYGNITSKNTSGTVVNTPTSTTTNRLTGAATYDAAGNLTSWNANIYQYDNFNQMVRYTAGAEDWAYIYTADDERFWSYGLTGGQSIWSLRDLDGKLLRRYDAHLSWSTRRDYIYRGTQLLASNYPGEGDRHFALDHLGTPRLVTAASGSGAGFYTLTPCRVLDTRNQSGPLSAGETRTVSMAGSCGIPSGATAVSVNITVANATTQGEMTAFPAGASRPTASAISYRPSLAQANNAVLKLGNGALAFYCNQASGSAHLIIDVNGYFIEGGATTVAYHAYYPFGEEVTSPTQDVEARKFTGHERDFSNASSVADDLDYMHARHYSPLVGRFLSFDPIGGIEAAPQSWNRYAYVMGRTLSYIDPEGLQPRTPPPAGMAWDEVAPDYYYGEGMQVSATTRWRFAPGSSTGLWGLGNLFSGRAFLDSIFDERFADRMAYFMRYPSAASMRGLADYPAFIMTSDIADEVADAMEPGLALYAIGATRIPEIPGAAGYNVTARAYPNAGGGGVTLLKDGRRIFGIDWHRFKLAGQIVNRLHYHLGRTASQLAKHRPWQGGWW